MFATSFGDEAEESPPPAASAEAYRAQALTSTALHAHMSDLSRSDRNDHTSEFPNPVGQGGMCGRLRSNSSSKVLSTCRRRRRLICCVAEGSRDSLSGQPKLFAAPACSRIRVRDRVRHECRNDKNLLPEWFRTTAEGYSDLESDPEIGSTISDLFWGGTITCAKSSR